MRKLDCRVHPAVGASLLYDDCLNNGDETVDIVVDANDGRPSARTTLILQLNPNHETSPCVLLSSQNISRNVRGTKSRDLQYFQ